ncbi:MAG: mandelate racemase/muconate lactonizing enzyme family protein [Saprospiraceae bacterium]|nr:mandelate racemase/muconate lactonizing enzyme family protein [Saprospiraceae bacterium]
MFRRSFFKKTATLLAGTLAAPDIMRAEWLIFSAEKTPAPLIDFCQILPNPVAPRRIELLKKEGWDENRAWFVRIVTDDVAYTMPANSRIQYLRGIFNGLVAPFFIGKDLRNIEALVEACYRDERNYKYCGMPLWNCIGHVEIAALGLLGTLAGKPVAELYGTLIRRDVETYYTTFDRKSAPEEYAQKALEKARELGVRAMKVKIGGRMAPDPVPGRTEAIIPLFRKIAGDDFTLYADANGSYENLKDILRIGRRLHAEGYEIWEEPCPFREYELTRQATKRLKISIAGGEQDSAMPIWRRMIAERIVDVVQPDLMYTGGFARALRVARTAAEHGLQIAPHSPHVGHLHAPMLHLAAITPNMPRFQEWQPNDYLKKVYAPNLSVEHGRMPIPLGPGWGVTLDPDFVKQLTVVEGW